LSIALAGGLAGCGTISLGAVTTGAPAAAAPVAPADLPIGDALGTSLGAQLDPADRQAAYAAEVEAVSSGERHPWRGPKGAYGYVDAGGDVYRTEGACRQYTQTIYIAGRPHTGTGLGCHQADGSWHILN
jgi:surface antigen